MTQSQPQEAQALVNQGLQQLEAGENEAALTSLDCALAFNTNNNEAWRKRGDALGELGRYEEALTSYDRAIAINPKDHEAWYKRYKILFNFLGRYEEAYSSYDKAIALNHKYRLQDWLDKGNTYSKVGNYKKAIFYYDLTLEAGLNNYECWYKTIEGILNLGLYQKAIASYYKLPQFNSNDYQSWCKLGEKLYQSSRYREATVSYDKAIQINSNYYQSWYNRSKALYKLGRYEEAIFSYDKAIEIKPNDYQSWYNRSETLYELGRYEEALASLDQTLSLALSLYRESSLNIGKLHYFKGKAYFFQGQKDSNPDSYWHKAKEEYEEALQISYREGKLSELYLEVLQDLIKICRKLGDAQPNRKWERYVHALKSEGVKGLYRLLLSTPWWDRPKIKKKFASFVSQMRVDTLAQSLDSESQVKALEIAEALKNLCLSSLSDYRFNSGSDLHNMEELQNTINLTNGSPKYRDIQQLLDPQTAAIYWHISPAALTTFTLQYNQSPQVWTLRPNSRTSPQSFLKSETTVKFPNIAIFCQLNELENLMERWKRGYRDYRDTKAKLISKNPTEVDNLEQAELSKKVTVSHSWQKQMQDALENLAEILDVQRIVKSLGKNIKQLILFPHRDLHLLPLEALFPENLTIIRLPSAQIGLDLQKSTLEIGSNPSLVSIEHPETSQPLLFAEIESAVLANLYREPPPSRITGANAIKKAVLQALKVGGDIFHFTGHAEHNVDSPPDSALALADGARLTMRELLDLPNNLNYYLVCLSACETGLANKSSIIDEFVGLVTAFLAKGTNYVVSTLWTVDEISSALIMIEFYRRLEAGATPPEALKQAKHWLRTVTYSELANWYGQRAAEVEDYDLGCCENLESAASNIEQQVKQSQSTTLKNLPSAPPLSFVLQRPFSRKPPSSPNALGNTSNTTFDNDVTEEQFYKQGTETHINNCPYSHPYYWAGFTMTGKVPNQ
ncbi:CHAT domain-containing protein [Scytonema sp. NUACC26]|uniref:CHAT domain-containing protein n=1 Tax=Scytonema sp. NUACC26 TaxID=3140176 RepID=UPI0034DBB8D8